MRSSKARKRAGRSCTSRIRKARRRLVTSSSRAAGLFRAFDDLIERIP